ncbi:MAG: enoyl-CoA hydratase [Gammaproteobacteria bacterium]|tara:strand:+ start:354 stop:1124 length:771 start_codon:yes stop_codon:yes gene_type:complete
MTDKLILEKIHNTAKITINNPSANTWDLESLSRLEEIIELLNKDDEVFSLVITGQGEKFFSAGADLKVFHERGKDAAKEMSTAFSQAFEALSKFRGVSIAAINGFAMGGGLECALACDIRVAEEKAVLALPEPKVGLLPCGGGTQVLPRLVGEGWAKRIILTGEQIKSDQALKIGLIEEKVEDGKSLDTAMSIASSVANQSPSSIAQCKDLIHKARLSDEPYKEELEPFVKLFDTKDQKEGVEAFLDKRKPNWQNA